MRYVIIGLTCAFLISCDAGVRYFYLEYDKWGCTKTIVENVTREYSRGRSINTEQVDVASCVEYTRVDYINKK
jgi:hypothetical protein